MLAAMLVSLRDLGLPSHAVSSHKRRVPPAHAKASAAAVAAGEGACVQHAGLAAAVEEAAAEHAGLVADSARSAAANFPGASPQGVAAAADALGVGVCLHDGLHCTSEIQHWPLPGISPPSLLSQLLPPHLFPHCATQHLYLQQRRKPLELVQHPHWFQPQNHSLDSLSLSSPVQCLRHLQQVLSNLLPHRLEQLDPLILSQTQPHKPHTTRADPCR